LIAYDSLILLDEAHISEPFRQTLDRVHRYLDPQKWAEQNIGIRPVTVVPMTATPNDQMVKRGVIRLEDDDRNPNLPLLARLTASKPAELCDKKDVITIATSLNGDQPLAVGIIVNRIATARDIYDQLRLLQSEPSDKKRKVPSNATIELIIGSMRPIDRDKQAEGLRKLVGPDRPAVTEKSSFIVATQCLEVGADYDFDVLITECASLDALLQRFGRLNRAGRAVKASAYVLANKKDIKGEDQLDDEKPLDPIYGNALARTWNWLNEHATEAKIDEKTVKRIDFGIDAFAELLHAHGDHGRPPQNLLAPSASLNAPVMMPAYVDFWCQTAPRPVPDPDVSLFIHGTQRSEPDVQVCWRADLIEDEHMTRDQWCDVVALLPPTSAECMSVSISRVRRWLADQMDKVQDHGDALGVGETDDDKKNQDSRTPLLQHPGVLWRGSQDTTLIASPDDLRPGNTLVLPASTQTSRVLGHLPHAYPAPAGEPQENSQPVAINDVAETAFIRARDRAVLRLHQSLRASLPNGEAVDDVFTAAAAHDEPPTRPEWSAMLRAAADAISDDEDVHKKTLRHLAVSGFQIETYPDGRGVVLTGRRRLRLPTDWFVPSMDEGDDESSRIQRDAPILLADHTGHVRDAVRQSLTGLPLGTFVKTYELAADLHDLGKADERFQAMLRRTDRTDAWLLVGITSSLLAKSDGVPTSSAERAAARHRAGMPDGFRHEMLSVQLAELSQRLPDDAAQRGLILHLIAAHHGYARPFAPVVPDDELPVVEVNGIALTHDQRTQLTPAHRLDSGIPERFWKLTRRFGWWGLAYLETVLRLADQQASADEDAGKYGDEHADQPVEAAT
jgi:CRISPR-associated endonuclease/helicase Cas3